MTTREKPVDANAAFSPSRRSVLIGAVAGALAPQVAVAAGAGSVTNAPESDTLDQVQPFHGEHQPGIVTPRPAAGLVASFDVLAQNRAGLQRLLHTLTERTAFLMAGGTPPALDPRFPAPDSGILGPVVTPNNLTITTSLGVSMFDERFGLQALKPKHLTRMASFSNDALQEEFCHGDLLLQFSSNTPDTNIHALRDIVKNTPDTLLLRWKQEGSVPVRPANPGKPKQSARNFLGFRDGSANPDSTDAELMKRIVWVQPGGGEPAWTSGGSYQVVRLIRNFVERWDRTPLREQQTIIGRQKASGAPLEGGTSEADVPHFASDPQGKATPLDAHIRLANPRDAEAQKHLILRRPFNYSNGVSKSNQMDMGLLFICYQADLEQGFVAVQTRLNGEALEEYIKPFGGGYFFVLPGVKDDQDYLGRSLLEMAASTHA
ncbi:iron uptake transporter deferrochelatase/peroxidase subunit [Mesorhizobium sp. NZP2298]|uniref:iron uptake transporter deferrochelatase/peroxidase subunit n=1 Tax=Mesorhizobium sp. NZP2298 TaxID=2483403 RepID=UPI001551D223|nr:iron uptake transporter deferrochelatase/peroxidase subunit [Mesorhizobium sp. NZP2298]QKC93958.1 deferrochelatase/peroxidase EfeB [Mesorhizobium sp. NZP2298]